MLFNLFLFFLSTNLNANYKIIELESIDLRECIKIKESTQNKHSRVVYLNPSNNTYIKIWESDYIFGNFFAHSVKTGFFQDISPLKEIIYDKNNLCRGYITYRVDCPLNNKLKYYSFKGASKLYDAYAQNEFYKIFIEKLKSKIILHKVIYLDLVPDNIAFDCNEYHIIDLDPIININDIDKLRMIIDFNHVLSYNPDDYQNFIKDLLEKRN